MGLSGGYTHATFDADVPSLGSGDDGLTVRKGDLVQGVPRINAKASFDYHWALTGETNAFVRADGQFTGKSRGQFSHTDPDHDRASYFTVDASAGMNFDKWEFTLFVKNANNNHTAIQRPNVQLVSEAYYPAPAPGRRQRQLRVLSPALRT